MKRFVLQAVQDDDHLAPAREVFQLANLDRAIISTAFMSASGLSLLQAVLDPIADKTKIFVGIRNGVTTVQSNQKALEIGCETYMVDTGSRNRIFHPKLYYSRSPALGRLLLGSANLTMGGLRTNIEASVLQEFGAADAASVALMDDLEAKLDAMIVDFPEHVIRAVDNAQLAALQASGRLVDERKTRPPEPAGSSANRDLDTIPKMALKTNPIAVPKPAAPPPAPAPPAPAAAAPAAAPAPLPVPVEDRWEQVWESNGLTRRHLNIPDGDNTNPTGSMLMGVGAWDGIDQRHYFRDEVFAALDWVPEPSSLALSARNMMICFRAAEPKRRSAHSFATRQLIAAPRDGANRAQPVQVLYRNPGRAARFRLLFGACFCIWFRNHLRKRHIFQVFLATPAGFEPATCPLGGGCSIQLSHGVQGTYCGQAPKKASLQGRIRRGSVLAHRSPFGPPYRPI